MPRALVINPNTSPEMTADIRVTAEKVFTAPWEAIVKMAPAGPESLESWTDYHLASVCVLPMVEQYQEIDGVVLACFGDPGLYVFKEVWDVPVIGIAEASISMALLLGAKFGILAAMGRAVGLMDSMVRTYGMESRYAGTLPLNMRVLDFEKYHDKTLRRLEEVGLVLRDSGAEVLLLGCAGLTSYVDELQALINMPIVDPVEAGCRMLKTVVESGLNTSHIGLYASPAPQNMNNMERFFTDEAINALSAKRKGDLDV